MRYGIVSDIHANIQAWQAVLRDMRKNGVDAILCLGDVIGYGPNPVEVLDSCYEHCDYFILGNHDAVIGNRLDSDLFNDNAKFLIEWTRDQLSPAAADFFGNMPLRMEGDGFVCAHGELALPGRFGYIYEAQDAIASFTSNDSPIMFVGHTHFPAKFTFDLNSNQVVKDASQDFTMRADQRYLINAGSVGDPRDGQTTASYCIFDAEKQRVMYRQVPFDIVGFRHNLQTTQLPVSPFFLRVADGQSSETETIRDMQKIEANQAQESSAVAQKIANLPDDVKNRRQKLTFSTEDIRSTRQMKAQAGERKMAEAESRKKNTKIIAGVSAAFVLVILVVVLVMRQKMADTAPPVARVETGETTVIAQKKDEELVLRAAVAKLPAGAKYDSKAKLVLGWLKVGDKVSWKVNLATKGWYEVILHHKKSSGSAIIEAKLFTERTTAGVYESEKPTQSSLGYVEVESLDDITFSLRGVSKKGSEITALNAVRLVYVGTKKPPGANASRKLANQTSRNGIMKFEAISGDADSGIENSKRYTHAIDFGNNSTHPTATINGVVFANGGAGDFPGTGGGASHTIGTGSSTIRNQHAGDDAADAFLIDGGIEDLVGDMIYNDETAKITLSGLTGGQTYQFRLYHRSWGDGEVRPQNITFDTDGIAGAEHRASFDEDDATKLDPAFGSSTQVYALTYNYTLAAGQTKLTVNIDAGTEGTYHLYALTNEFVEVAPLNKAMEADVSFENFEDGKKYSTKWTRWGKAFSSYSLGKRNLIKDVKITGQQGLKVGGTLHKLAKPQGGIRSTPFDIKHKYINLLISSSAQNVMKIMEGETELLSKSLAEGNKYEMTLMQWDVSALRGKTGVSLTFQNSAGNYFLIDDIVFSDKQLTANELGKVNQTSLVGSGTAEVATALSAQLKAAAERLSAGNIPGAIISVQNAPDLSQELKDKCIEAMKPLKGFKNKVMLTFQQHVGENISVIGRAAQKEFPIHVVELTDAGVKYKAHGQQDVYLLTYGLLAEKEILKRATMLEHGLIAYAFIVAPTKMAGFDINTIKDATLRKLYIHARKPVK